MRLKKEAAEIPVGVQIRQNVVAPVDAQHVPQDIRRQDVQDIRRQHAQAHPVDTQDVRRQETQDILQDAQDILQDEQDILQDEQDNTGKPTQHHLRRFGCIAYKLTPKDLRVDNKKGARAKRCRFTSYVRTATGIRRL